MNHLTGAELRNRYFLMRHGQSKANVARLIVSSPATDASGDYGLTALGREQAGQAAGKSGLPPDTAIYASPLARARQTAEIVREHLGAPEVTVADALRERFFGDWEGTDTANYETVWAGDLAGGQQTGWQRKGVEPITAVLDRATAFVAALDRGHQGQAVLLVSHGDVLQILLAGFAGLDPARHRSLPHLNVAEIRPAAAGRT